MDNPPSPRDIERWYPETLSQFCGMSEAVEWAKHGLQNGFANTLFTGTRGSAKTRMVSFVARSALCVNRSEGFDPCMHCHTCKAMHEGRESHWGLFSSIIDSRGSYFPIDCERVTEASLREILDNAKLEQVSTIVHLDEAVGLSRRGLERGLLKAIDESRCIWIATSISALPVEGRKRRKGREGLLPELRRRFAIKLSTSLPAEPALHQWIVERAKEWVIEIEEPERTIPHLIKRAQHRVGFVKCVFVKAAMYGRKLTWSLVEGFNFDAEV